MKAKRIVTRATFKSQDYVDFLSTFHVLVRAAENGNLAVAGILATMHHSLKITQRLLALPDSPVSPCKLPAARQAEAAFNPDPAIPAPEAAPGWFDPEEDRAWVEYFNISITALDFLSDYAKEGQTKALASLQQIADVAEGCDLNLKVVASPTDPLWLTHYYICIAALELLFDCAAKGREKAIAPLQRIAEVAEGCAVSLKSASRPASWPAVN